MFKEFQTTLNKVIQKAKLFDILPNVSYNATEYRVAFDEESGDFVCVDLMARFKNEKHGPDEASQVLTIVSKTLFIKFLDFILYFVLIYSS